MLFAVKSLRGGGATNSKAFGQHSKRDLGVDSNLLQLLPEVKKSIFYKITNHHCFSPLICSLNRLIRYTRFSTRHRSNSYNMIKTKKSPKSPHCCILFSFSLKAMLDFEILKFTHSMFTLSFPILKERNANIFVFNFPCLIYPKVVIFKT